MNDITMPTWKSPDSYFGFDPVGDYMFYMKTRDSEIMVESNFDRMLEDIRKFIAKNNFPEPTVIVDKFDEELPSDWVYTFTASHWGCSWVEYILVRKDAPEAIIEKADEIYHSVREYPVYDEDDYSERQDEAIYKYWGECSIKERIQYCKEAGDSIFAARHEDHIPEDVYYSLREGGSFY